MEVNAMAIAIQGVGEQRKIEMDLSYQRGDASGESGVFSNKSDSADSAADSSWECIKKEVVPVL